MKGSDQEHDAERRNSDSLENTQWTRVEAELELGVKSVRQERDTRAEASEIG
jgi:hypothetical protein